MIKREIIYTCIRFQKQCVDISNKEKNNKLKKNDFQTF